jgi:[ribosomal protein S18]-alanine N-acetyltransferase
VEKAARIVRTIRQMEERDIESILAIQAACPEIAQWTAWDYDRVARGEMAGWTAEEDSKAVGFIVARRVVNEIEILNFAVRPGEQRHGIGAALLQETIAWGKSFSAVQVILEVRASNAAALRFYEKHKFRMAGRRARYYDSPREDALLLNAPLS